MAALAAVSALGALTLGANPASAHPDDQHGDLDGHLLGTGEWGKIDLLGVVDVTDTPDLIADVAVSPDGNTGTWPTGVNRTAPAPRPAARTARTPGPK
jgi:hypothetical protein